MTERMRFDVYALPHSDLAVQSFRARGLAPYLTAHEELRAEVATALANSGQMPDAPLDLVSLAIVCFVGAKKRDGYYRPERVHTLHYTLDPIYRALLDGGVISGMEAIYEIRIVLVRDSPREGFRIDVTPLRDRRAS